MPKLRPHTRDSVLNFIASLLNASTQTVPILLVTWLGALSETANFTLCFAAIAPLQQTAGMAFGQLLIAGDPDYSDPFLLIVARLVAAVPIFALMVIGFSFSGSASLVWIAAAISVTRSCELVSEICQAQCRRNDRYIFLVVSRGSTLAVFAALIILHRKFFPHDSASLVVGESLVNSTLFGMALDMFLIRHNLDIHRRNYLDLRFLFLFIANNMGRGLSIFVGGLSANLLRYILQFGASPEIQAAYSLLATTSRVGILFIQSILYPLFPRVRTAVFEGDRRRVTDFAKFSLLLAVSVSAPFVIGWIVAVDTGLVQAFNKDILHAITPLQGTIILLSTAAFNLRVIAWNFANIALGQRRQLVVGTSALVLMAAIGAVMVHFAGANGAAFTDSLIGTGVAIVVFFSMLPGKRPAG